MNSNHLHLKLRQTQQLSQNLQYSLRVLQMSGQEIEREVEDWLADNPLLERAAAEDTPLQAEQLSAAVSQNNRNVGGEDAENAWENIAKEDNLYSYLHAQVCEHPLSELQAAHVHVLIDFLDEHGYLTETVEEILDNTPLEWQLSEEDIEQAIENLQNFEPAGIATANLQQSLLHQLARLPTSRERSCAAQIVSNYLSELKQGSKQNSLLLVKKLPDYDLKCIQAALEMIGQLNPYPAFGFSLDEPTSYIHPEVVVKLGQSGWYVQSNDIMFPKVQINTELADALNEVEQIDAVWKEKAIEAKQKLDILSLRKATIMRIAEYVVEKQQDFFQFGEIGLVPMLLKECAQHLDLAESTISRAVNQKYLSCPLGVFPMRYFFSQTAVIGEDDEGISQNVIKAMIAQIIDSEDKTKPYSDNDLMKLLQHQGINISRRTVAKYRDLLQIAPANGRRVV